MKTFILHRILYIITFAALILVAAALNVRGQGAPAIPGALKGVVRDRSSGVPLEGALIRCLLREQALAYAASTTSPAPVEGECRAYTGRDGTFEIHSIPPGEAYGLVVSRDGYALTIIRNLAVHPGAGMAEDVELCLTPGGGDPLVFEEPAPRSMAVPQAPPARSRDTHLVFATREGLVGSTTANGHVIKERDHFVALPSKKALCASDGSAQYQVQLTYKGKSVTVPVWDVGPWNTKDDYWSLPAAREMWNDLAQWLPEAQAAYTNAYNGGKDGYGRVVKNPAGIDLGDGVFIDDLAMTNNDWIEVRYLWLEGPAGVKGDINQDGVVNSDDGKLCLAITVGNRISYPKSPTLHAATAAEIQAADMNGDGVVGVDDAILILEKEQ